MILLEELQALWRQLHIPVRGEPTPAVDLQFLGNLVSQPLITVDEFERRHLLIPISDSLQVQNDVASAGIHVTAERWGIGNEPSRYVDVACLKPELVDLFNLVILDILDEVQANPDHPDLAAHYVLERWRMLIQRVNPRLPDRRKILGLIGELWFLRELIRRVPSAILGWKGPEGDRYDFNSGQSAVEVKASLKLSRVSALINSHLQLEKPPVGQLYLLVVQMETAPSADISLSSLVQELIDLGCNGRLLMTKLSKLGFVPDVISRIKDLRINVVKFSLFEVNESFPKIVSASFTSGRLPIGVEKLQYRIDLSDVMPLSLAKYEDCVERFTREMVNDSLP